MLDDFEGKVYDDATEKEIAKLWHGLIRVWVPDMMGTADYQRYRLNVVLDENKIITEIYFG